MSAEHLPVVGTEDLAAIYAEAVEKYERGEAKHGPFTPATDNRDLLREAESELLDAINYLSMHLLKLRALRDRHGCGCQNCASRKPSGSPCAAKTSTQPPGEGLRLDPGHAGPE